MSSTTSCRSAAAIVCSSRRSSAQIAGDAEGVVDELLAGSPRLARVRALGELERAPEQVLVDLRVVRLDLGYQLLDEVFVVPFCVENAHVLSVLSTFRTLPARRSARRGGERQPSCTRSAAGSGNASHAGWRSPCATRSAFRPGLG